MACPSGNPGSHAPDGRQVHHDGGVRDSAVRMHTIVPEGCLGCWPGRNVIGTAECKVVSHSRSVGPTSGRCDA